MISVHVFRLNVARIEMFAFSERDMGQFALARSAASTKSHSATFGTVAITSRFHLLPSAYWPVANATEVAKLFASLWNCVICGISWRWRKV